MNTYSRTFWPPGGLRPSPLAALRRLSAGLRAGFFLAMLGLLGAGAPAALADESPIGCTGSALGINLFTSTRDVHIGDTIAYSVTIFNGLPGSPRVACDATEIQASSLMTMAPSGRRTATARDRGARIMTPSMTA